MKDKLPHTEASYPAERFFFSVCGTEEGMEPALWVVGVLVVLSGPRLSESALPQEQKTPGNVAGSSMCWMTEEFGISKQCSICNEFEAKRIAECSVTGFIEQVQCTSSRKAEYKSCRSVMMEKQVFWQFVAGMVAAAVALSLLVVFRQRTLDRRALEKVRKQIESI
ncbi:protein JTB [Spea bombifrons]|uniref:protein JTB n=1 Tax=Spea bombifrons TaxID=233779 RepID=UPI00234BBEA1|nr:protein JTB [Spea bombifrons]